MQKSKKDVAFGVALGHLLGSLGASLFPVEKVKRAGSQAKDLVAKAKQSGLTVYDGLKHFKKPGREDQKTMANFVAGTLVGLLVGAGSALFLTPRSGKQLRKNVADSYQDLTGRAQEIIDYLIQKAEASGKLKKSSPKTRTGSKAAKASATKKPKAKTKAARQ